MWQSMQLLFQTEFYYISLPLHGNILEYGKYGLQQTDIDFWVGGGLYKDTT